MQTFPDLKATGQFLSVECISHKRGKTGSKLQDLASQLPFPKGKYKHPTVHTETSVLGKIVGILGRAQPGLDLTARKAASIPGSRRELGKC